MNRDNASAGVYRGNRPRSTAELSVWHAQARAEEILEPALPIVDPHHHLFGSQQDSHFYRLQDFERDLAAGHNVLGTVLVEAYGHGWRTSGPEELRSLGEVETVVSATATPSRGSRNACQVAAGIVSNVNLTLGENAVPVLEAHIAAGQGRLRGVRHHALHEEGLVGSFVKGSRPKLLADPTFRRGLACLERFGLSFDALIYHTQLDDVADLADALPDTPIVLSHLGQIIGVAEYSDRRAVFETWQRAIRAVAARPNVHVKVGGMGMPIFGFGFDGAARPAGSTELAPAWQPYIDVCLDAFGTSRCMFEANFPVDMQSTGYVEAWNAFKLASRSLSQDERRDLFYRSACRAYRLPALEASCDVEWQRWQEFR
jgi:L-fuconolactonase